MPFIRSLITVLLTIFVLQSCTSEDESTAPGNNPLLTYVPADTPYVFANLEPVPSAVIDAWLARLQPVLTEAQASLEALHSDLAGSSGDTEESFNAVAAAVLQELDGKLNRPGFESLGLSLESMHAVYGNGLFPVVRMSLGDPQALRDTVARVAANANVTIPEYQRGGANYWKISEEDEKISIYIAILDGHLALSVAPHAMENEFLPGFLGQEMPSASMADGSALASLNRDKGFLAYGSGYMDMALATEEILDANRVTARYLAAMGADDPVLSDPACANEARLLSLFAPRLATGVTELDAQVVALRYHVDVEPGLASELKDLVANVAPASRDDRYIASGALGIKVGSLREFLRNKATLLGNYPFQCEHLQAFKQQAAEAAEMLSQPLPLPVIANLRGFRGVIEHLDPSNPEPENMRALFSLEVEKPQMLIGMASMMLPGFEALNIEPGADPVKVPQELLSVVTPELEVHAVMSRDAIGLSLGEGMRDGLAAFMKEDTDNGGTFLSIEYDMAALAELQREAATRLEQASPDGNDHYPAADLMDAYNTLLGRSRTEFRFTEAGMEIESTMTYD